jgi:hypothetical protein
VAGESIVTFQTTSSAAYTAFVHLDVVSDWDFGKLDWPTIQFARPRKIDWRFELTDEQKAEMTPQQIEWHEMRFWTDAADVVLPEPRCEHCGHVLDSWDDGW